MKKNDAFLSPTCPWLREPPGVTGGKDQSIQECFLFLQNRRQYEIIISFLWDRIESPVGSAISPLIILFIQGIIGSGGSMYQAIKVLNQ